MRPPLWLIINTILVLAVIVLVTINLTIQVVRWLT